MNKTSTKGSAHKHKLYLTATKLMHLLGIAANLKGHAYIRGAAMLIACEPQLKHNLTTKLYPQVAKHFNVSPYAVERNIRTSIERAWLTCDPDILYGIFGGTIDPNKGRPSNAEFLAILADMIIIEMTGQQ